MIKIGQNLMIFVIKAILQNYVLHFYLNLTVHTILVLFIDTHYFYL